MSIIIPVYNLQEGRLLEDCLQSLSRNRFEDMEIWLIDDGSTDESGSICDAYVKTDERAHVIHQNHIGPSARNTGLRKATGEWIMFLDGDDIIPNEFIDGLQFEKYKKYDLIFFNYHKMKSDGTIIDKIRNETPFSLSKEDAIDLPRIELSLRKKEGKLDGLNYQMVWAKLYRRSFLKDNSIFFTEKVMRAEDLIFNLNVYLNQPKCYFDPSIAYIHRTREGSLVYSYWKDLASVEVMILEELKQVIQAHGRLNEFKKVLDEKTIDCLFTCVIYDYCNPRNKKRYLERKRDFQALRNSEPYMTAVNRTDYSSFKLIRARGRVLAWLCKYQLFLLIELYVRCASHFFKI